MITLLAKYEALFNASGSFLSFSDSGSSHFKRTKPHKGNQLSV
jgi:hypothetical protein